MNTHQEWWVCCSIKNTIDKGSMTLTKRRIQNAALERFATQGFEATSLLEIATDVGIKKPSIYAHFKNKDEIFLSLIPLVIDEEIAHAKSILYAGDDIKQQLYLYLVDIKDNFSSSYRSRFWIRTLFAPPVHIYEETMRPMHLFMEEMEATIENAIVRSKILVKHEQISVEALTLTYMSMIDSLQSELLFGGADKYKRRLDAIWSIFRLAIP